MCIEQTELKNYWYNMGNKIMAVEHTIYNYNDKCNI